MAHSKATLERLIHNMVFWHRRFLLVSLLTFILVLTFVYQLTIRTARGECGDFTSLVSLSKSHTLNVTAINPKRPYYDRVVVSFHNDPNLLKRNNAQCKLQLHQVHGMTRTQLQNTKPRILEMVIENSKADHIAYIDWDANWIKWPRITATPQLLIQGTVGGEFVITGVLVFLHSHYHRDLVRKWIAYEKDWRHDQNAWHQMERDDKNITKRRDVILDGVYAEHYNWNCWDKKKTVVRCNRLVTVSKIVHTGSNIFIGIFLIGSLTLKKRLRSVVVVYLFAICLTVIFQGYPVPHRLTGDVYASERICTLPESALLANGAVVTRFGTSTAPNSFLALLISIIGMTNVASLLSFWFLLVDRLRFLATAAIIIDGIKCLMNRANTATPLFDSLVKNETDWDLANCEHSGL